MNRRSFLRAIAALPALKGRGRHVADNIAANNALFKRLAIKST